MLYKAKPSPCICLLYHIPSLFLFYRTHSLVQFLHDGQIGHRDFVKDIGIDVRCLVPAFQHIEPRIGIGNDSEGKGLADCVAGVLTSMTENHHLLFFFVEETDIFPPKCRRFSEPTPMSLSILRILRVLCKCLIHNEI